MNNIVEESRRNTNSMVLKIWSFFNRSVISAFEKPEALNTIIAAIEPKFDNSWLDADWLKLSVEANDENEVALLCTLASELCYSDFSSALQTVNEISATWDKGSRLYRRAGAEATRRCRQMDEQNDPVPLDLWLALGSMQYPNPFMVFENVTPAIFQYPAADIIAQSITPEEYWFRDMAEDYASGRKRVHAKSIKALLKALDRMDKSEQKNAPGGGPRGALRGVMGRFKRRGGGGE